MSAARSPIRAVAFDLDGTLVDSAPDIGHALNAALLDSGLGAFEMDRVREWIGDGPDVLIERALQALGLASPEAALRERLRAVFDATTLDQPLAHGQVFEGIAELVQRLQGGWPMVVVTNKPTALARAVLRAGDLLPCFTDVYGADSAARRKPAPAMLQQAARDLGLATQELLMVGDSAADLGAAHAAGSPAAWAEWGYAGAKPLPIQPQWRIGHPRQLWPILQGAD
jgi:phosphoglycolate phosphatase